MQIDYKRGMHTANEKTVIDILKTMTSAFAYQQFSRAIYGESSIESGPRTTTPSIIPTNTVAVASQHCSPIEWCKRLTHDPK